MLSTARLKKEKDSNKDNKNKQDHILPGFQEWSSLCYVPSNTKQHIQSLDNHHGIIKTGCNGYFWINIKIRKLLLCGRKKERTRKE
jgi:hypothetical protein